MVASIGYTNGYAQCPQYAQRQAYMPQQTVSFAGNTQPTGENENKKKNTLKKGIIAGIVGVAAAAVALYAGVKTGVLKKVDNPTTVTDKLKNLAFKGGDAVDKGVTGITNWAKDKLSKTKGGNTKTSAESSIPNIKVNFTEGVVGEEEIRELMAGMNEGAKSGTCKSGAKWEIIG